MKVKVFFTVDVEIWCNGWDNLDAAFPDAFRSYVYGPTPKGDFGLPRKLQILNDHGLHGVFFTEPLFSGRFGQDPLQEVVGLIQDAGQEVQLHLHTEWANETQPPLLPGLQEKRQHLCHFNADEQAQMIGLGKDMLQKAGAKPLNAFRAGSFGMNKDTPAALEKNGLLFDSSYNMAMMPDCSEPGQIPVQHQPIRLGQVAEYPMTVFNDSRGKLRHAQLGSATFSELKWLLRHAAENAWESVMILSHNFELLNPQKTRPDPLVIRRFQNLCRFLEHNSDTFETFGFTDLQPIAEGADKPVPTASTPMTLARIAEQGLRRFY